MKYKIEATIPTQQYGNIKPEFTIESGEEEKVALDTIKNLWATYGEKPLKEKGGSGEKMVTFTGETVLYNDDSHSYYDLEGNVLLSGSYYAEQQGTPFNKEKILEVSSKNWGVESSDIDTIWGMKGDVSRHYGNAIHSALELYHRFNKVGGDIAEKQKKELNYTMPSHGHIRDCVQEFVEKFGTDAEMEVLVSDVGGKMAGRIDRLVILDEEKKVCRVGDFKTNHTLDSKKLKKYQHQLSFYAHILMNHGWTVEGLDIYHYAGSWELTELPVLDLEPFK